MIRNAQPGIPAIGCTADVISLMWNIAIVSMASIMMLYRYTASFKYARTLSENEDMPWFAITRTPLTGKPGKPGAIELTDISEKYARLEEEEEGEEEGYNVQGSSS